VVVVGCCLLYEHYSLRAFWHVLANWGSVWRKRKAIMGRKRVSDEYMAEWFGYDPVSRPAPKRRPAAAVETQGETQVAET
jgi:hypothetical protein